MKAYVIKNKEGKYYSCLGHSEGGQCGHFENELNEKVWIIQDKDYAFSVAGGVAEDFNVETNVQIITCYEGDFSKTQKIRQY